MNRPISYTGSKPYIFISYSHADMPKVLPIIARLQADGFRIWYDGDIESGGEWADIICEHVDNCRGFIGFISRNSLDSEHCKDELSRIKKNRNATRVLVYLDNSELTGGMALNNERYQSIRWDSAHPENSFAKLYTARGLSVCNQKGLVPTLQLEPEPYVPRRHTSQAASRPAIVRKAPLIILGAALVLALLVAVPRLLRSAKTSTNTVGKLLNASTQQTGDTQQAGGTQQTGGAEQDADTQKESSVAPDSVTVLMLDGDAVPMSPAGGGPGSVDLTSITEPAEQSHFSVRQDVTNTLGITYRDAAVLFGSYTEPYVRYYVGDYSVLQGNFSVPQDVSDGNQFTLTVYLDDNATAPLPGYDRLELSRSSLEQSFSFDVSSANFITFALQPKDGSHISGLMLTDCYLYSDASAAPAQTVSSGRDYVQDGKPLTSITEPAEKSHFEVRQDVTNTLGTTYRDAAVLFGSYTEPYVRYYVGDYRVLQGKFSVPQDVSDGSQFTLTVYLDDNATAPLPGYDRLELSRSSLEQSFSFDVSNANFITFALKPKEGSHISGLMLTDCYLYRGASSAPAQTVSSGQNPAQDGKPLTSITEPAEQSHFDVRQDVTNTLGITYRDAAVLFGSYTEPYVRYYVGDYSLLQGNFSVPQDVSDGSQFTLTVYLDDNDTAPLSGYDRLELSRSSLEQSFSFDVSSANFITFALQPKDGSHISGLMLTDCYLYSDASAAPAQTVSSGQNPAQDGKPLTSITEPAEQSHFDVRQDVTNTLGTTYRDAAVLFGSYTEPYVRYYVGDYSVLQGKFSVPQDVSDGSQFTLTVYLDDNATAPLSGYDRLELSRSSLEQSFSFDVSGANFITFALEPKDGSHISGLMLTDCYLYQ